MKTLYKNLLIAATGAFLSLFFVLPANAQHSTPSGGSSSSSGGSHASSGGGGGSSVSSSRSSGSSGSSASYSRSSGSSGGSRSSVGGYGVSRPSAGVVQHNSAVQRNGNFVARQGVVSRGNYGYVSDKGVVVRNNYGYPQRVGIVAGRGTYGVNGYRTAPRIGYGHGSYWSDHGYLHYNHGYYKTTYGPRIGYRCRVLPYRYYSFFWADFQYYFCDGLFYTYDNDEYTVIEPPIGAEVTTLPDNAQSIVINGQQYYECNGVYYQPVTKDDGTVVYMVAGKDGELNTGATIQDDQPRGPQLGDVVTQLPENCRKIKVNGERLFVSPDGVYYQEIIDADGNKTYKIVGLPSDEPDEN
jgi:hypothetical protein